MLGVTDLKVVTVTTPDVADAVETFRKNFGLRVIRQDGGSTFLGIAAAEIEMSAARGAGSGGLDELTLEVADLENARAVLAAKAIAATPGKSSDGRVTLSLDPRQTHGVRITLIGR